MNIKDECPVCYHYAYLISSHNLFRPYFPVYLYESSAYLDIVLCFGATDLNFVVDIIILLENVLSFYNPKVSFSLPYL